MATSDISAGLAFCVAATMAAAVATARVREFGVLGAAAILRQPCIFLDKRSGQIKHLAAQRRW